MPPGLRRTGRRIVTPKEAKDELLLEESALDDKNSDLDIFAKEVLSALIQDNLPPTPNNYSLYFDRMLENKDESFKKQVHAILELEESNDAENTIILEQNLKQGFGSIKNILTVTANLYKNMGVISKILEKRKQELSRAADSPVVERVMEALESDIAKLNTIVKKQSLQIKELYQETGNIIKKVGKESIFDDQYGVYNKRYLFAKIEKEINLIQEFKHESSLIMLELSRELRNSTYSPKVITMMTRTIARLLMKTSRRSDVVAHYGKGMFVVLLKHTNIESAKKASERLCDLVSNSNFFLADKEIQLKVAIGITKLDPANSPEETIVAAMDAIEKSYEENNCYAVTIKENNKSE